MRGGARWCSTVPTSGGSCASSAHDGFDTWLIGWDSHQGVDLHDHGGSAGAFYVVDGELLETSTRRAGADAYEQRIRAGTARAFGPGHVHRVINPAAAVATSVHVYSPPLVSMDFYEANGAGALERTHREPALGTRSGAASCDDVHASTIC